MDDGKTQQTYPIQFCSAPSILFSQGTQDTEYSHEQNSIKASNPFQMEWIAPLIDLNGELMYNGVAWSELKIEQKQKFLEDKQNQLKVQRAADTTAQHLQNCYKNKLQDPHQSQQIISNYCETVTNVYNNDGKTKESAQFQICYAGDWPQKDQQMIWYAKMFLPRADHITTMSQNYPMINPLTNKLEYKDVPLYYHYMFQPVRDMIHQAPPQVKQNLLEWTENNMGKLLNFKLVNENYTNISILMNTLITKFPRETLKAKPKLLKKVVKEIKSANSDINNFKQDINNDIKKDIKNTTNIDLDSKKTQTILGITALGAGVGVGTLAAATVTGLVIADKIKKDHDNPKESQPEAPKQVDQLTFDQDPAPAETLPPETPPEIQPEIIQETLPEPSETQMLIQTPQQTEPELSTIVTEPQPMQPWILYFIIFAVLIAVGAGVGLGIWLYRKHKKNQKQL